MKKFNLSLIAASFLFAACNTAMMEGPVQYGTLSVALADEPVVEVVTKAETFLKPDSEEAKDYVVRVFNADNEQQGTDVGYNNIEQFFPMSLQLGTTYYVTAENCTMAEAEEDDADNNYYGKMRLFGRSEDVDFTENLVQEAVVRCEVVNARVVVEFDSFALEFIENLKVLLEGGTTEGRKITFDESSENTIAWFNPSELSYTISGNNVQKIEGTITLKAKDDIKLLVKVNNGQLTVASINVDETINQGETIKPGFNPYN